MKTLTRRSPAKINLTLRVLSRRPDGYHDIESLIARISLHDTVNVEPRPGRKITLTCSNPAIPCDKRNLAWQAANRLAAATGTRSGVHISIQKRIPIGAGLGGGSSNAATVLMLLNELWGLHLAPTELERIGAEIGSDVPLFFRSPLCIVRGRGERIDEIASPPSLPLVLFLPQVQCPTAAVYAQWDRLGVAPKRPPLSSILAQLHSPSHLRDLLFNDLEDAAVADNPAFGTLIERLRAACPYPVHMTGSGSTLFCLTRAADRVIAATREVCRTDGLIPVRILTATTATAPARPATPRRKR